MYELQGMDVPRYVCTRFMHYAILSILTDDPVTSVLVLDTLSSSPGCTI